MKVEDFKYQYSMIKKRCKNSFDNKRQYRTVHRLDFDTEYLKEVWDSQKGICPFTGYSLILKTYKTQKDSLLPQHASVDRIKNKSGYIKGNIRFISVMSNYALNRHFNDIQLIKFCKEVYRNNND